MKKLLMNLFCYLEMYLIAKTKLKNEEDIADAIQETIYSCYKNLKKLRDDKLFKTWLIKILINEIPSINLETKRTITYSNGKQENWAIGDIGTYKDFNNAKLETIEYLIIEQRDDIASLKIIPKVEEITFNETGTLFNWKEIGEYNIDISE